MELAAVKTLAKKELVHCTFCNTYVHDTFIRYEESESDSSHLLESSLATEDASPASGTSSSLRGRMSPVRNDPRWRARYSSPVAWSGSRANVRSIVCFQHARERL